MPLFEPVWKTNKEEKLDEAMIAVRAADDPKKLRDIALNAPLSEVRCLAVEKISDEKLLREIILSEQSAFDVRKAAVKKITDENILAEIAVLRSCYPADGEAIAQLENPQLLKKIAMSEQGWEQAKAVYKISDQKILAEIAAYGEKGAARKTAIRSITDLDVLLDMMESSVERFIKNEAFRCFVDRLRSVDSLTSEQHSRYLNVILKEVHKDDLISLDHFHDRKDLEQIYRHAQREDLRAEAFSRLIAGKMNSRQTVKEIWKLASRNYVKNCYRPDNPWVTVLNSVTLRILNSHDPSLFVECIAEPDCGADLAADFLGELFGERFQDEAGIELHRDEGVAVFLENIDAYRMQNPAHDNLYCLRRLASVLPAGSYENKWYYRFLRRVLHEKPGT